MWECPRAGLPDCPAGCPLGATGEKKKQGWWGMGPVLLKPLVRPSPPRAVVACMWAPSSSSLLLICRRSPVWSKIFKSNTARVAESKRGRDEPNLQSASQAHKFILVQ